MQTNRYYEIVCIPVNYVPLVVGLNLGSDWVTKLTDRLRKHEDSF